MMYNGIEAEWKAKDKERREVHLFYLSPLEFCAHTDAPPLQCPSLPSPHRLTHILRATLRLLGYLCYPSTLM